MGNVNISAPTRKRRIDTTDLLMEFDEANGSLQITAPSKSNGTLKLDIVVGGANHATVDLVLDDWGIGTLTFTKANPSIFYSVKANAIETTFTKAMKMGFNF